MYLRSFDSYHSALKLLTGYIAPKDVNSKRYYWIFLFSLYIINILGLFSIGMKKIVEKRKNQQVIPLVNNLQSQQPQYGHFQSFINNVAFNKPLLSLLPIIILSITMIVTDTIGMFVRDRFKPNEDRRELITIYLILISNIIVDVIFPLLYTICNKDYYKHTRNAVLFTLNLE